MSSKFSFANEYNKNLNIAVLPEHFGRHKIKILWVKYGTRSTKVQSSVVLTKQGKFEGSSVAWQ